MDKQTQQVRVEIDKTLIDGFIALSISSSLQELAPAFTLELLAHTKTNWIKPFGYQQLRIFYGQELLLTGRIEKISRNHSQNIRIEGRSLTAVLIDCNVQPPLQYHNMTLASLAQELLAPYGLSVENRLPNLATQAVMSAEQESTIFHFLNESAEQEGIFLASTPAGDLLLRTYEDLSVQAKLKWSEGRYSQASITYDSSQRFSEITLLSQNEEDPSLHYTLKDTLAIYRPSRETVEASDMATLQAMAKRKQALAIANSVQLDLTLHGWQAALQAPRLLQIGDVIELEDSSLALPKGLWMIQSLDLALGAGQMHMQLKLAPPTLYQADITLGALPWQAD